MQRAAVEKIITELLSKLGVEIETIQIAEVRNSTEFQITPKDAAILIGSAGETFSAFTHIVRKLVEKELGDDVSFPFSIDVSGYQAQKVRDAYERVQVFVERARTLEGEVELPPMSSYDRLLVHQALTGLADIRTESKGEGKDRRVVIQHMKKH